MVYVARKVKNRGVYRVLVGKPEGKRPLETCSTYEGKERCIRGFGGET